MAGCVPPGSEARLPPAPVVCGTLGNDDAAPKTAWIAGEPKSEAGFEKQQPPVIPPTNGFKRGSVGQDDVETVLGSTNDTQISWNGGPDHF